MTSGFIDIARNVPSRLTFDPGNDFSPVWSPESTRIAFQGTRSLKVALRQLLIARTATEELLLDNPSNRQVAPSDWSANGRFIAFTSTSSGSFDVWVLPLLGDRKPFPVAQTQAQETDAVFSPDARWIAYATNESGQSNVVVQPFPPTGGKYQVSREGGGQPVWRADGKELFYLGADGTMMAVPIDATDQFNVGVRQVLFPTSARLSGNQKFAVTKDGKRFLVSATPPQARATPLTVVLNWTATIQKWVRGFEAATTISRGHLPGQSQRINVRAGCSSSATAFGHASAAGCCGRRWSRQSARRRDPL